MRVGLTLSGDNLSEDGAMFAAQLGVTDVVVHFNDYAAGPDAEPYLQRGGGRADPQGLPQTLHYGTMKGWPAPQPCWRGTG